MGPRTARRSRRVSPLALAVTIAGLVLAGWAVRGLLESPVPRTEAFGSSAAAEDVALLTSPAPQGPPEGAVSTAAPTSSPPPGRAPAALPDVEPRPYPVRLTVPSVGLDVTVEGVGVSADGQMEIPDEGDRAGWYEHGPPPGSDRGSAVLASHVDTVDGPAAFLSLTRVREGDEVEVELSDGTRTTYRVVGGEQVAKSDLAVDEIFRRDGDPVLRLVTCSGDWSPRAGSYTDNLVITAVPLDA